MINNLNKLGYQKKCTRKSEKSRKIAHSRGTSEEGTNPTIRR